MSVFGNSVMTACGMIMLMWQSRCGEKRHRLALNQRPSEEYNLGDDAFQFVIAPVLRPLERLAVLGQIHYITHIA